jgi:hypothetical protein
MFLETITTRKRDYLCKNLPDNGSIDLFDHQFDHGFREQQNWATLSIWQ